MVIRVIGSTFALLLLTSATAMTLLPLPGLPADTSNNATGMSLPIQCTTLSDTTYHFKLFFGFAVIAIVFAVLRFAFVHQSKKNGSDHVHDHGHHDHGHHDHGHHDHGHHDHKYDDDYHLPLTAVATPRGDEKKVGEPKPQEVAPVPKEGEGKEGEKEAEKEADEKEGSSEDSEDSDEKRKKRRERRRRRRERRERRKRDDGSDEDDDDD